MDGECIDAEEDNDEDEEEDSDEEGAGIATPAAVMLDKINDEEEEDDVDCTDVAELSDVLEVNEEMPFRLLAFVSDLRGLAGSK